MLRNQDIICISSIDWDFIWQGHQEIMTALAKKGNRILFIENTGVRTPGIKDAKRIKKRIKNWFLGVKGIRKISDNLYVFSPIVLPLPYFRLAVWFNSRHILSILNKWFRAVNFSNPIIWTFLPTPLSISLIERIMHGLLVYYCIDDFVSSSKAARKIRKSEIKMLRLSDLVFATSIKLYDYCSSYNINTHIFPFGVNYDKFEKVRLSESRCPAVFNGIKRPVVGYVGGLHKWVDLELLRKAALSRPNYSFVFVGPAQSAVTSLQNIENVYFLGQQPHEELPYFIKSFDVSIIPYLITDYTKNVYPTKLNEYLAMGKPVVSTALPEVLNFNKTNENAVYISNSTSEFIGLIDRALLDSEEGAVRRRLEIAKKNSWDTRIYQMSKLIIDEINNKKRLGYDWKANFARLFRKFKGGAGVILLLCACFYAAVFYTPIVWIIAKPLYVSDQPRKADAIVVFAGGVGETGKAGQGYEERVSYAVSLYKQGYADKLIFSTGYAYFLEEAAVMKAIAMSLNVPGNSIILEDKARSTYQNVVFTKEILDNNKMNSILLVSSPYHMRRAKLVFDKIAKEIKVIYTPVQDSIFYTPPGEGWKKVNVRQINGIAHEYLGILYYWLKGQV